MLPLRQEHCATQAGGVRRKIADIIQRALDALRLIARNRRDDHLDRCAGDFLFTRRIAADGKIHHAISLLIFVIPQAIRSG